MLKAAKDVLLQMRESYHDQSRSFFFSLSLSLSLSLSSSLALLKSVI